VLKRIGETIRKFWKVLDGQGQAIPSGFEDTIGILPPRTDVDGEAVVEAIERNSDEFTAASRPLGDDDRESDDVAFR